MSKERLEDLKERFVKYEYDYNLNGEDVDWLINRVEELEKREGAYKEATQSYSRVLDGFIDEIERLQEQNKRYREVLKNIYELAEYDEYDNTLEQIVSEIEKALGDEN